MGARENAALVCEYLARVSRGDPSFSDLFADDIVWWVTPGSKAGGTYEGRAAVLEMIGAGVERYAAGAPLTFEIERVVADDEWASVQLVLEARTAAGRAYRNHYHIAFQLRAGAIVYAKEYLDTKVAADAFG